MKRMEGLPSACRWPNRIAVIRAYAAQRDHFFALYERIGLGQSIAERGSTLVETDWRAGRGTGPAPDKPEQVGRREE